MRFHQPPGQQCCITVRFLTKQNREFKDRHDIHIVCCSFTSSSHAASVGSERSSDSCLTAISLDSGDLYQAAELLSRQTECQTVY